MFLNHAHSLLIAGFLYEMTNGASAKFVTRDTGWVGLAGTVTMTPELKHGSPKARDMPGGIRKTERHAFNIWQTLPQTKYRKRA